MTIEEFVERYNQEVDWGNEILSEEFFKTHPFLKSEFGSRISGTRINKDNCDLESAKVYNCLDMDGLIYYEAQIYNTENCGLTYYWVHPRYSKEEYKKSVISSIVRYSLTLKGRLIEDKNTIDAKLAELEDLFNHLTNQEK